jgi:formylglycine-generating enzyme required for sulfatase activity
MSYVRLGIDISRHDKVYTVVLALGSGDPSVVGKINIEEPPIPLWDGVNPRGYGSELLDWLLSAKEDNDNLIRDTWNEWKGRHPNRRIVLTIDKNDEQLQKAVWECMQDDKKTLAKDRATPFSRKLFFVDRTVPKALSRDKKLKILLVVPRPVDREKSYPQYRWWPDPEDEEKEFLKVLDPSVELKRLPSPCSVKALAKELKNGWHIVHFIGHGSIEDKQPSLLIENDDGNAVWLESIKMEEDVLGELGPEAEILLFFLASCDTDKTDADTPQSLAFGLMTIGIPSVIAMQDEVDLPYARDFALEFYQSLLKEGRVDLAANEARRITCLPYDREDSDPFIPVLYNRLEGGILIEKEQEVSESSTSSQPWNRNLVKVLPAIGIIALFVMVVYLIGSRLSDPPSTLAAPTSLSATPIPFGKVTARALARVRQGPGTGYYCLGEIERDSEWPIVGKVLDDGGSIDWWQIRWKDKDAWIGSSVFYPVEGAGVPTIGLPYLPPTLVPSDPVFGLIEINDGTATFASMRSDTSIQARIIRNIPQKELVEVLAQNINREWARVRWCGHEGWVCAKFVKMSSSTDVPIDYNSIATGPCIPPLPTVTPTSALTPAVTPAPTKTPRPTTAAPNPITYQAGERKIISLLDSPLEIPIRYIPPTHYQIHWDLSRALDSDEELEAFWIDEREVSNALFIAFLNDRRLEAGFKPSDFLALNRANQIISTDTDGTFILDPTKECEQSDGFGTCDNHPVVLVTQSGAQSYCKWIAGNVIPAIDLDWQGEGRLPLELEWELAAIGVPLEGWEHDESEPPLFAPRYPWGPRRFDEQAIKKQTLSCTMANLDDQPIEVDGDGSIYEKWFIAENQKMYACDGFKGTAPVDEFKDGASPFGVLNMIGNVKEWTDSIYQDGPPRLWTIRGHSYVTHDEYPYPQIRFWWDGPTKDIGFRCVYPLQEARESY